MLVEDKPLNVQRSGVFKEHTFRIKASAKAFDILSKGIYTDIPMAIVRELSTNAYDAHVDAKNTETPFTVHLPNDLEPFFSIRDYGTGLSPYQIETLYTTYFESNKTKSNDFTGCLGIGSKSPFAYADSFTVSSYYNGTKYIYTCFRGEEGFPKVAQMHEEPTDEHNGLEVSVAIKREDYTKFSSCAKKILRYFPLTPEVIGNGSFSLEPDKPIYSGTGWTLSDSVRRQSYYNDYKSDNSIAVMGNIPYPIRDDSRLRDFRPLYYNYKLVMYFDIGELDIAANREELQWEEKTIAAIEKKLHLVKEELIEIVQKEFKDAECYWDARCLYGDLFKNYGAKLNHLHGFFNQGEDIRWRGKSLTSRINYDVLRDITAYHLNVRQQARGRLVCSKDEHSFVDTSSKYKLIVDDLEKGGLARTRNWMKETGNHDAYYFHPGDEKVKDFVKRLHDILGTMDKHFTYTSALPKIVYARSTPSAKKKTIIVHTYKVGGFSYYSTSGDQYWEKQEINPAKDAGMYVPIKRWQLDWNNGVFTSNPSSLKTKAKFLERLGRTDPIYGLKTAAVERIIKKSKKWVRVEDAFKKEVIDFVKKHNLKETIEKHHGIADLKFLSKIKKIYEYLNNKGGCSHLKFMTLGKKILDSQPNQSEELKLVMDIISDNDNLIKLEDLGIVKKEIAKYEKKLLEAYPMVTLVFTNGFGLTPDSIKTIADHIISKG